MTINQSAEMTRSDLVEFNTHSFVIKMWLEVTPTEAKKSWRGHITHIPSGERLYVRNLFCILTFITSYLKSMGIKFGRFWWIKDWLASRKVEMQDFGTEMGYFEPISPAQEVDSR